MHFIEQENPITEKETDGDLSNTVFWVVTWPTEYSTGEDILFNATLQTLEYQFRGGLEADEIAGFFLDQSKAERLANSLLESENRKPPRLESLW